MLSWTPFYAGAATAAATLMGLLFVAVSVGASAIVPARAATARALSEQALANLLTTLLIALAALMPDLSLRTFGKVALGLSALPALLTTWRIASLVARPEARGRLAALHRHGASLAALAMLVFAAATLSAGRPDHLVLVAVALLMLIGSATMAAWDLLLSLGRHALERSR